MIHNLFPSTRSLQARNLANRFLLKAIVQQRLAFDLPLRIVLGSGGLAQPGWIRTEIEQLDVLDRARWLAYFSSSSIDALLAEHVWEHLSLLQAAYATSLCWEFLKPGGYFRVAVPDGYHPSKEYVDSVRPGGSGFGPADHRMLYTYRTLGDMVTAAGFDLNWLEYFDEQGTFHSSIWDPSDGMVRRSKRFDERNQQQQLAYTSLILDARKPNALSRRTSSDS